MSTTAGNNATVLKDGWLMKRSKVLKQWKNQWVVITDECILYSFKHRSDKQPSQRIDLREFPITKIVSEKGTAKSKPKPMASSSSRSASTPSVYVKRKQKEIKRHKKQLLGNKIIQVSSVQCNNNNHNKIVYEFKTLSADSWMTAFRKCHKIMANIPNADCLFIQQIPTHLMSTVIASFLYSYERFILCRVCKWLYSIFNINEYNFIYHYYSDCLYWIRNIQQYVSTLPSTSHSHSSSYATQICKASSYTQQPLSSSLASSTRKISLIHHRRNRKSSCSAIDSVGPTISMLIDLSNGNLSHLLSDSTRAKQFRYFLICYPMLIQVQTVLSDVLHRKLTLKQKLLLKESYSAVFEQRKCLPSYLQHQQQQNHSRLHSMYKWTRSSSHVDVSYNSCLDDDISYLMIPCNIAALNVSGNKKHFQRCNGMQFLYSILLCNNYPFPATVSNPLSSVYLDDNLMDTRDLSLFCQALLRRNTAMDNLESLSLNSNPEIYSAQCMQLLFDSIGSKCPNLRMLSLRRMTLCNDEIFKIIVQFYRRFGHKTKLKTISLVGCSNITVEGIDWFNKNMFEMKMDENHSELLDHIDILLNMPKTQIIKHHHHRNRWDKRIVLVAADRND